MLLWSRIKKIDGGKFIPLIKRKRKLFKSKLDYILHTEHMHYFAKNEVVEFRNNASSNSNIDPRCVICGLKLTQYRDQIKYETMEIPAYRDGR